MSIQRRPRVKKTPRLRRNQKNAAEELQMKLQKDQEKRERIALIIQAEREWREYDEPWLDVCRRIGRRVRIKGRSL